MSAGTPPSSTPVSPRLAVVAGSIPGAFAAQVLALATGGRDLRAGTTTGAIIGLLIAAVLGVGVARRWARVGWPASLGVVLTASAASIILAGAMFLIGWLVGFYYPNWTAF